MEKISIFVLLALGIFSCTPTEHPELRSPRENITISFSESEYLSYSVVYNNEQIIANSKIAFDFKNAPQLGENLEIERVSTQSFDETWEPVLKRYATIRNHYNEMLIELKEKKFPGRRVTLEVRAYDDGVAFRTHFHPGDPDFNNIISDELTEFNFIGDPTCWAVDYKEFDSHQESDFRKMNISDLTREMVIGLPLTIEFSDRAYGAITEAALVDYAGMYLTPGSSAEGVSLKTQLAPRHGEERNGDKVHFSGDHVTPWRLILLAETPGELIESEMIQNLNDACQIKDPSWIKPGISAWDHWWSGEVKMEQDVIYQYIDLAAEMKWEYMLIDWQWYGQFDTPESDIMTVAPQLDMPKILNYAKDRGVRCWVWLYWTDVDKSDFDAACQLYQDWGIAGVKIDFMARDDQEMVNWYHKIVKTAAKHQLMVDFHGAYKPSGWRRTYPNLVTREGVMGNEYQKWSYRVTPEHDCTLPFTRMLAGPMDYTPGGFLNCNADVFKTGTPARVQGTRAHELAKFVIFDSPFMVACDHPDHYREQSGRGFLQEVPSVWDDTRVLNGEIGEYIGMARRSGNKWFIAALNNSEAREYTIALDFLENGKSYELVSYSDTEETLNDATATEKIVRIVNSDDRIQIKMAPGGGFAGFLEID